MTIREAGREELPQLLALYLHLHEDGMPEDPQAAWDAIMADPNHHIIVCEIDGRLVASCVCVVIPNLTRGARPYALVENVVTHRCHRGKGYATACLAYAQQIAQRCGCYKMMLLTGAKDEKTLRFYRHAGYNSADKTAFIQWLSPANETEELL